MTVAAAEKRLADLATEIEAIEAEITTLTADHESHTAAGRDAEAAAAFGQIRDARERLEMAQARRGPLERALERAQAQAQAKVANALTADADARREALAAAIVEATQAAAALAKITDALGSRASLDWGIVAAQAVRGGGDPARGHLPGVNDLLETTERATRTLRRLADDYMQRATALPRAGRRAA